ncbi:hypothetical protein F66182_506 [Fusarium sp. NRRL 66182]|nr:hypothetical protein F66182_506 [Fusarium sp. NRRL 66182]
MSLRGIFVAVLIGHSVAQTSTFNGTVSRPPAVLTSLSTRRAATDSLNITIADTSSASVSAATAAAVTDSTSTSASESPSVAVAESRPASTSTPASAAAATASDSASANISTTTTADSEAAVVARNVNNLRRHSRRCVKKYEGCGNAFSLGNERTREMLTGSVKAALRYPAEFQKALERNQKQEPRPWEALVNFWNGCWGHYPHSKASRQAFEEAVEIARRYPEGFRELLENEVELKKQRKCRECSRHSRESTLRKVEEKHSHRKLEDCCWKAKAEKPLEQLKALDEATRRLEKSKHNEKRHDELKDGECDEPKTKRDVKASEDECYGPKTKRDLDSDYEDKLYDDIGEQLKNSTGHNKFSARLDTPKVTSQNSTRNADKPDESPPLEGGDEKKQRARLSRLYMENRLMLDEDIQRELDPVLKGEQTQTGIDKAKKHKKGDEKEQRSRLRLLYLNFRYMLGKGVQEELDPILWKDAHGSN